MKKLILFISLFLIFGCASRKVSIDKIEIKKDSITQINTKTELKEVSNIEIKNDILTDEILIKPIDSSKEIVVNGIKYKNVVLSIKKVKDNSLYLNNKTIQLSEDKQQKSNVSITKKEFKKEIDKKANYFIYLWLLLIPIGYLIYNSFFKNKTFFI